MSRRPERGRRGGRRRPLQRNQRVAVVGVVELERLVRDVDRRLEHQLSADHVVQLRQREAFIGEVLWHRSEDVDVDRIREPPVREQPHLLPQHRDDVERRLELLVGGIRRLLLRAETEAGRRVLRRRLVDESQRNDVLPRRVDDDELVAGAGGVAPNLVHALDAFDPQFDRARACTLCPRLGCVGSRWRPGVRLVRRSTRCRCVRTCSAGLQACWSRGGRAEALRYMRLRRRGLVRRSARWRRRRGRGCGRWSNRRVDRGSRGLTAAAGADQNCEDDRRNGKRSARRLHLPDYARAARIGTGLKDVQDSGKEKDTWILGFRGFTRTLSSILEIPESKCLLFQLQTSGRADQNRRGPEPRMFGYTMRVPPAFAVTRPALRSRMSASCAARSAASFGAPAVHSR